MLNPDMPDQELRLHMGEMTAQEMRTARTAIRWANSRRAIPTDAECLRNEKVRALVEAGTNLACIADSKMATISETVKAVNAYRTALAVLEQEAGRE